MTKFRLILRTTLSFILTLLITVPTSAASYTVSDETLNAMYANGDYYYNPEACVDPNSSGAAGVIEGDSNEAKIWNYFVTANIDGISDNPAAIAGILGNLQAESGFNPFAVGGGTFHGLYQSTSADMINAVTSATGSNYWGSTDAPEEAVDAALRIELEYLVNDQFAAPESRFANYKESALNDNIGSSSESARIFAELFMVAVERCIGGNDPLEYQQSRDLAIRIGLRNYAYSGWQHTARRRDFAADIYDRFASTVPITSSGEGTSTTVDGSDVTIIGDSITVGAKNALLELMPEADINAVVSRHFGSVYDDNGIENLERTIADHKLRKVLVFALGTNDANLSEDEAQKVIDLVKEDGDHQIIFVTNYNSHDANNYAQNNALFNSLAGSNDNVFVADWAGAAGADPSKYLSSDGIHPTADGQQLFAQTIYDAISSSGNRQNTNFCDNNGNSAYTGEGIPQYYQCDPQWGSLWFGIGGKNGGVGTTICDGGCGPSSFAMMATALLGQNIYPDEVADVAGRAGMYAPGQGSYWGITGALAQHYGLQYEDLSTCSISTINQYLNNGWMIHTSGIGSEPFTSGGHYIGITGVNSEGQWYVANSANTNTPNQYYSPQTIVNAGMACDNVKAIKK